MSSAGKYSNLQVAKLGDLDFALASTKFEETIDYFAMMLGVSQVVDKGINKTMVVLKSGLQVDLLMGEPNSYGALLQHFTGSNNHMRKL